MGLFKEEAGKVQVDLEIKIIPEFAAIIRSDKDRHKRWTQKIFEYIYMVYDFRSPYNIYTFSKRKERLLKHLDLTEKEVSTSLVEDAIKTYVELNETPTTKILSKTQETLLTSVDVMDKIRQRIETTMENEAVSAEELATALTLITRSLSLAEQIPKNVKILKNLEDEIRKELAGDSKIRGGGKVNEFEK